jgi:hemerythrin-like domain-containing protein
MRDVKRRVFLAAVPVFGLAAAEKKDEGVAPAEDLMREHGLLNRILLVYEEVERRLAASREFHPAALADAAGIVRKFIEQYHEKLEEDHLFPRFRKAGKLVDLVDTLEAQHKAGRRQTEATIHLATAAALKDPANRRQLGESLRLFVRMYRPHEAREDTILFPAFHQMVSAREYAALGEQFEDREHQLLGADGFEKMVDRVAAIERDLGIYDLKQFTPA